MHGYYGDGLKKQPENIAVLGAGIMGLISAYTLGRALPDAHITIYDPQGFPSDNASFMAGGMLAPYSELDHMPISFLPAGLESINLWRDIAHDLGADIEFAQNGSLIIAHDEDRHLLERFKSILPADGWHSVNTAQIESLERDILPQKFRQGIHIAGEAHLNPQKAMRALCTALPHKEQRTLSLAEAQNQHDLVIDCRGLGAMDTLTDLRGVKGEVVIVKNPEFSLNRPVRLMHPRYPLYIVPREDHVFLIGATIIESSQNAGVSLRSGLELLSALYSLHPSFGEAQILEFKSGIRPSYPDNLPHITQRGNVITANGLYRHGYLFSPIMAACICALASNQIYEFNQFFVKEGD